MYLRECIIENVGPISSLDLTFELNDDGSPKPIVFVGQNGTGKTLLLAYVLDALCEFAKVSFQDVVENQSIESHPYIKVTSGGDTRSLGKYHYCLLEFQTGEHKFEYVEKVGAVDVASVSSRTQGRFKSVQQWPSDVEFHKRIAGANEHSKASFLKGAICFFPSSRHEVPHWLNLSSTFAQRASLLT